MAVIGAWLALPWLDQPVAQTARVSGVARGDVGAAAVGMADEASPKGLGRSQVASAASLRHSGVSQSTFPDVRVHPPLTRVERIRVADAWPNVEPARCASLGQGWVGALFDRHETVNTRGSEATSATSPKGTPAAAMGRLKGDRRGGPATASHGTTLLD
jgi:hypothetical protein